MVSWQAFPSLPPSSHTPCVSLAPKNPLSLPFQTPATQASRRPKMCRPAADEAPLRTREKTCGTQGSLHAWGNKSVKLVKKIWTYENHIWELRSEELCEIILIIASYRCNFCSCEKKAWKKLASTGIEPLTALRYRCSALTWIELTSQPNEHNSFYKKLMDAFYWSRPCT